MALEDVCRELFEKYNSIVGIVSNIRTETLNKYNELKDTIGSLVEVPQNILDDMLDDLNDINVTAPVTLSSVEKEALKCLMNALGDFNTAIIDNAVDWSNIPNKWLEMYIRSLRVSFKSTIFNIMDANILGQAGNLLTAFEDYLESSGMAALLDQLDALLGCINAGCSAIYPGTPDYAGDIRTELSLGPSNKLDTSIYSSWNGDNNVVNQLNEITGPIRNLNTAIGGLSLS